MDRATLQTRTSLVPEPECVKLEHILREKSIDLINSFVIHQRQNLAEYTVFEKDCTLFFIFFLGAQCVESGVSCTDCY